MTFVTRLKRGVKYRVLRDHDVDIRTGVMSDQTIELTSKLGRKAYPGTLRRVGYWDEETRRRCVFVTNNTTWVGKTIADLYKSRWQIELFFKWIKQNLKVKRFVGRSKNVRLFFVGGPERSRRGCERHGKSYLTRRRRGEEGDGGGSLTGGAIPSA